MGCGGSGPINNGSGGSPAAGGSGGSGGSSSGGATGTGGDTGTESQKGTIAGQANGSPFSVVTEPAYSYTEANGEYRTSITGVSTSAAGSVIVAIMFVGGAPGSYRCTAGTTHPVVTFDDTGSELSGVAQGEDGDCEVVVTAFAPVLEGTFTAHMLGTGGEISITAGTFRAENMLGS